MPPSGCTHKQKYNPTTSGLQPCLLYTMGGGGIMTNESKRSMLFANRGVLSCFTYSAVTSPLATGSCSSHTAASSPAFLWIGCEAGARCAILFISRVLLIFSRISFRSSSMKCVPNKRAIKPSTAHDEPRIMLALGSWTANNKHLIQ